MEIHNKTQKKCIIVKQILHFMKVMLVYNILHTA